MQVEFRAEKNPTSVLPGLQSLEKLTGRKQAVSFPASKNLEPLNVSAVIITYNEEAIIGETLSKLWWCDEIVIIDSGSRDKTVEICRHYGCNVFTKPFKGFGEQKQFGVSKAKNDWILCVDADEVLSDKLVDEINFELTNPANTHAAFAVTRNLVFMNRVFNYGRESNSSIIRLFNKTRGNWDGAVVHEKVSVNGTIKKLENRILHYSYHDYSQFLAKINLYSSLNAEKMLDKRSPKPRLLIILAIPFNFFKYYIIDRNFLNGYRGFAWSVLNTGYHFVKYLKLEELKRKKSQNK